MEKLALFQTDKRCSSCRETKPLDLFHRDKNGRDGRTTQCAACNCARTIRWGRARGSKPQTRARFCKRGHDLTVEENRRPGRWECAVCHRERQVERYRENPEKHQALGRQYAREHKEAAKERWARWRAANLEHVRTYALKQYRRRRVGRDEASFFYSEILARDPCCYCGDCTEPRSIDHIVPQSAGGSSDWTNLTAACPSCNSSKHATSLVRWLARRGG